MTWDGEDEPGGGGHGMELMRLEEEDMGWRRSDWKRTTWDGEEGGHGMGLGGTALGNVDSHVRGGPGLKLC